jgi:hypothetical protein
MYVTPLKDKRRKEICTGHCRTCLPFTGVSYSSCQTWVLTSAKFKELSDTGPWFQTNQNSIFDCVVSWYKLSHGVWIAKVFVVQFLQLPVTSTLKVHIFSTTSCTQVTFSSFPKYKGLKFHTSAEQQVKFSLQMERQEILNLFTTLNQKIHSVFLDICVIISCWVFLHVSINKGFS